MSFKEALNALSTDTFFKFLLPSWAMGLTARTRRVGTGFDEFEVCYMLRDYLAPLIFEQRYMIEMIQERRSVEKKEERADLFTTLLDAAEEESTGRLTDRELLGALAGYALPVALLIQPMRNSEYIYIPPCWTRGAPFSSVFSRRLVTS
jgi:hypothetical protein